MSKAFESEVLFSELQIELMSKEIGEILGKLKDKSVIDLKKSLPIILINRGSTDIEFEKTNILKLKLFTSLMAEHIQAFRYLVRNHTFINEIRDVIRSDRIMGSINYEKTTALKLRNINYSNNEAIVCSEIARSYNTPENLLLALILFSIMLYCDKCITMERLILGRISPTLKKLQVIRNQIVMLLTEKSIRQILPVAVESRNKIDSLFDSMMKRIQSGKISRHFTKIYNLFYKWKYYTTVSLSDSEIAKDVLQYHFMELEDKNDLYECWVFCKILYALSLTYDLKFVEIDSTKRKRKGLASFVSSGDILQMTYQLTYITDWEDQSFLNPLWTSRFHQDIPDISIELPKNGITIIIDAKNSLLRKNSKPNLDQMRSYMTTSKAKYGIFLHSDSEQQNAFKYISNNITGQQIIWTSISPACTNEVNSKILDKILALVGNSLDCNLMNDET